MLDWLIELNNNFDNEITTSYFCDNAYKANRLKNDEYFTSIVDKVLDTYPSDDDNIGHLKSIYKDKFNIKENGWCTVIRKLGISFDDYQIEDIINFMLDARTPRYHEFNDSENDNVIIKSII